MRPITASCVITAPLCGNVDRPISRNRGRRPHCTDNRTGSPALYYQVEEVCSLLDRVSAMSDENAVNFVLPEQTRAIVCQTQVTILIEIK